MKTRTGEQAVYRSIDIALTNQCSCLSHDIPLRVVSINSFLLEKKSEYKNMHLSTFILISK